MCREKRIASELLKKYCDNPEILGDGVAVEFNPDSGNVFLIDEDFKQAIIDGIPFDRNEIPSLDHNFHVFIIDRSYTPEDALFILKNTENEETDNGLWEGQDWEAQLSARAAYSFGNDVWFKAEEMYNEVKERCEEIFEKAQTDEGIVKKFPLKIDIVNCLWSEYFDQFTLKELTRDSPEELQYLKTWINLSDNAGTWGSYPLGHSYIDSRCGYGYSMPEIKDFVDHDNQASYLVPWMVNKSRQEVRDRISQLEEKSGTTTIQVSRNTKRELDNIKKTTESYEDVIKRLVDYMRYVNKKIETKQKVEKEIRKDFKCGNIDV